MMPIADLTFDEQLVAPLDNFCEVSQHKAPETWVADGETRKVKFYKIKGRNALHNKTICELCLIVANFHAENTKSTNAIKR